jgi:hypothetical protein
MNIMQVKINKQIKYEVRDYAIEKDPVKILGRDFKLQIAYRNLKVSELSMIGRTIKVSLPNKYKKIGNVKILNLALDKMYEAIAREEVERIMEKTRIILGFAPEDYEIKKMPGILAHCSEDKKITINPEIVKYSRATVEYIIMHEFCHLKYKTHGKRFYEIIKEHIPNYKKYEIEIASYKF